MAGITIEFDPPGYRPTEEFDFLGRKAAEVLADLFPGVQVVLRYKQETPANIPGVTVVEHSPSAGPEIVGESFEPVLGQHKWWRQLTLMMAEESRKFLGVGSHKALPVILVPPLSVSSDGMAGSKSFPTDIPPELKYAFSIAEDVSRAWAMHVWQDALPETRLAFASKLPLWIVAHIAADQCYSFASYGSKKGKHDILAQAVAHVVEYLENLVSTRVEHQELSHGVVIAPPSRTNKPLKLGTYPDDFHNLKRTPLLADGVHAALWISPRREPIGWITAESLQKTRKRSALARNPFGPLSFLAVASELLNGLALGLRTDGSIVIFAKGRPLFVKRSGRWRGMLWSSAREAICKEYGEVGAVIFNAALILSTTGHGGVLGIVENIPDGLEKKDLVDIARKEASSITPELMYHVKTNESVAAELPRAIEGMHPEWLFHTLLPSDQASSLGSSMIAMLAAIDGATIISKDGRLLAYGAVIPSRPSKAEGARSAAARELSNVGFVIKVSADGPIALYDAGKQILEL